MPCCVCVCGIVVVRMWRGARICSFDQSVELFKQAGIACLKPLGYKWVTWRGCHRVWASVMCLVWRVKRSAGSCGRADAESCRAERTEQEASEVNVRCLKITQSHRMLRVLAQFSCNC